MASDKTNEKKGSLFAPFSSIRRSPATIKKHMFQRFNKNEYDQLKQDLVTFGITDTELNAFFQEEGIGLLMWALGIPNARPLQTLINIAPLHLKEILKRNDYHALECFLLAQMGIEDHGGYNQKKAENQIQKFKMLLSIDSEAVEAFMDKGMANKKPLSNNLKANFATALEQFKEENSSPAKKLAAS